MRWPFFAKYAAVSTATKISANKASTRGLPDSATTASASWSRRDMMQSRRLRSRSHRSRNGTCAHADCAARARTTTRVSAAAGVFSKYPRASPVAGFIEGRVSTEMAVAAIRRFYLKTTEERMDAGQNYDSRSVAAAKCERKQGVTRSHNHVLFAVEFVGDSAVCLIGCDGRVPKRLPGR